MPIGFDLSEYENDTFIETGTYRGYGLEDALDYDYDSYLSVDVDSTYVSINRVKFGHRPDVRVFENHSPEFLEQRVSEDLGDITFWLDAHADGSGSLNWITDDLSDEEKCPVYEEIEALASTLHEGSHVVMVDDTRIIDDVAWGRGDLSVGGVKRRLRRLPGDVTFSREDGIKQNDVLTARC